MTIETKNDKYVHGMDWENDEVTLSDLSNYIKYGTRILLVYSALCIFLKSGRLSSIPNPVSGLL